MGVSVRIPPQDACVLSLLTPPSSLQTQYRYSASPVTTIAHGGVLFYCEYQPHYPVFLFFSRVTTSGRRREDVVTESSPVFVSLTLATKERLHLAPQTYGYSRSHVKVMIFLV